MPTIHIIKNKTLAEKVKKSLIPLFHRFCKRNNPAVYMGLKVKNDFHGTGNPLNIIIRD